MRNLIFFQDYVIQDVGHFLSTVKFHAFPERHPQHVAKRCSRYEKAEK
jgi:hypothetical protein